MNSSAKDIKILNESEIERRLDKILIIFRDIQDKDMFETYYKNFFSKRLLSNRIANAEKMIISKLKTECGLQYTHKLKVMMKNITLS